MTDVPITPWPEPIVDRLRDAKQTFIIKGESVEGQVASRDYGHPIAHLSLVDLTALARSGFTLLIHYEPGYRSVLKPIPTLEVHRVDAKKIGATQPKETLPS